MILINRSANTKTTIIQLQVNRSMMEINQSIGMIFYLVNSLKRIDSFSSLINLILITLLIKVNKKLSIIPVFYPPLLRKNMLLNSFDNKLIFVYNNLTIFLRLIFANIS